MKAAKDLIPWKLTDVSVYPYGKDLWSMNPSICLDKDGTWRCVMRIVDYAMPGGITIRSKKSHPAGHQTRNAMVIFDPQTWAPTRIFKMHERDDHPRAVCPNVGYEDMRLFRTDKNGLQGIAASLHLARDKRPADGGHQNQPPEQVLLSFDDEYNIVKAQPIRGDGWSGTAQKNWAPFDDAAEPRFIYSIGKGTMFGDQGRLHSDDAIARPSAQARAVPMVTIPIPVPSDPPQSQLGGAYAETEPPAPEPSRKPDRVKHEPPARRHYIRSITEVKVRGGRSRDASAPVSRSTPPSKHNSGGGQNVQIGNESTRMMGTGRVLMPRYEGLRGGTQLARVGDDAWLGIGHEMRFEKGLKLYWHIFYLMDSRGKLRATSEPVKLMPDNGIEFAAGMAIEGDRLVVSFGVDDMMAMLGETKLSAVMEILRPVEA